jgi:hypothetical protein
MKRGNIIKRSVHAGVIGAMAFAFFYQPAVAVEAMKDVSKEINDLRSTVVSAEVMIVPRNMTFRTSLREKDLSGSSCIYEVSEKKDLDSLLDTLAQAGIVEELEPKFGHDARIGVFLYTSDEKVIRLVTGPDYDNAPPRGVFNRTTPVVAQKGFEADMRIWAAQRQPTKTSLICQIGS